MGDDEVFLLIVSLFGSLWGLVLWGRFLGSGDPFRPRRHLRVMALAFSALGMAVLYLVLRRWADDEVRDHAMYLTLLMALGFAAKRFLGFRSHRGSG